MKTLFVLVRKDLLIFWRDRASVSLTFIVPFALIYLFGQIFGVNQKDSGPSGFPLAVVNECTDPAATKLVEALNAEKGLRIVSRVKGDNGKERPLVEDDVRPMMKSNRFRFALILPPDFVSAGHFGLHIKFLTNPRNEIESQTVTGLVQKVIFTNVPQLIGKSLQNQATDYLGSDRAKAFNHEMAGAVARAYGGNADEIERKMSAGDYGLDRLGASGAGGQSGAPSDLIGRMIKIDTEQVVGKDVKSPMATQLIGGWAMQFLLFAVASSAASLFTEKDQGIFQRILSTPASRADILWSRFLYGICLGLIQLAVLFLAGGLMYGIDIVHHLGPLLVLCAFAAASCTAFGMLIAAFSGTPEASRGISTLLILLMSALGGAWFPVSLMPEALQHVAKFTLVYWAMEGFSQVLWAHAPWVELLPTLGILAGITAGVMGVAWWRFRRGSIFE